MEVENKRKYEKPKVTKIHLDAQCAVLGACKANGQAGVNTGSCGPLTPCPILGS